MKKLLDALILVAGAAAFAVSFKMIVQFVGIRSPWVALMGMFTFLGLVTFARPFYLLKMPGGLRKVRKWELDGRLYQKSGVHVFGEILRRTPLRYLQPLVYLKRSPGDPTAVRNQLEGAEAAHFWAGLLIIPYMVYACVQNWWSIVFWFMVVQLVGHVYPIMNLRWVRGRLEQVLERKRTKTASLSKSVGDAEMDKQQSNA